MRVSVTLTSSDALHQSGLLIFIFFCKHWFVVTSPTHSCPSNQQHHLSLHPDHHPLLHQHSPVDVSRVTILPVSMTTTCCCPPLVCLCPPSAPPPSPPTQLPPYSPSPLHTVGISRSEGAKTDGALEAEISCWKERGPIAAHREAWRVTILQV